LVLIIPHARQKTHGYQRESHLRPRATISSALSLLRYTLVYKRPAMPHYSRECPYPSSSPTPHQIHKSVRLCQVHRLSRSLLYLAMASVQKSPKPLFKSWINWPRQMEASNSIIHTLIGVVKHTRREDGTCHLMEWLSCKSMMPFTSVLLVGQVFYTIHCDKMECN
jgi:hypothetical protein